MKGRYQIYKLLGREVDINLSPRFGGEKINGVVDKVGRDIFNDSIELTINGIRHMLREPELIHSVGNILSFYYGDMGREVEGYTEEYNGYEECISDYLERTSNKPVTKTVLSLGELVMDISSRWKNRAMI